MHRSSPEPSYRAPVRRFLDWVERTGNRLPDPLTLFVLLAATVAVASWLAARAGIATIHPGTGEVVPAVSLLTLPGLRRMITSAVTNFTGFPPLGTVLVAMIGVGVAERSGLVATGLRQLVGMVPRQLLTATLIFAGVNASLAADAGIIVLVPLGAVLFAAVGRHPVAGIAAAFAGVSGGFSANLLVTSLDPLLSGITEAAARLVEPGRVVAPTANYYFMVVSTFLLTAVGTIVTTRFVEPRLGPWTRRAEAPVDPGLAPPTPRERRALLAAALAFVLVLAGIAALALPAGGVLRDPDGGAKPFFDGLVALLVPVFLAPGLAYGLVAGTIRSDRRVAEMMGETMATMGSYIVLAFAAAQFVAWFGWSNLGLIVAVKGASALRELGLTGMPLVLGFMVVSAGINLLVASASAKWAVLAPVFVPMLMLVGIPPETTQAAYRVADSVTNVITPLMPYFPLILVMARRWDPEVGLGTLLSSMVPYAVAFGVAWTALLAAWVLAGVPFGP